MNLQIVSKFKYIQNFAEKAARFLQIDHLDAEIIITLKQGYKEEVWGYCDGDREEVNIELLRNSPGHKLSREEILMTLAHEMVHAKQYLKGELKSLNDLNIKWKKTVIEDVTKQNYYDLPWEQEADELEPIVYNNCK